MTQDEISELIAAFYGVFKVRALRESLIIDIPIGTEIDTPFAHAQIRTAHGHDGKSLELCIEKASVFPKHQNMQGGEGNCVVVIDDDSAIILGAALIAFRKTVKEGDAP